jgi:hypothetical protein
MIRETIYQLGKNEQVFISMKLVVFQLRFLSLILVDFTGGVSVAERARLFGAQVTHSSGAKNPPSQRSTANKQPSSSTTATKPTVILPSYRANINRYPNPEPK